MTETAASAAQLLALTRQRRAIVQNPRLSQTQVVCDLIAEAFANVAKNKINRTKIGLLQHFPGGDTYHVQFAESLGARGRRYNDAVNLGPKYVVHCTKID